MATLPGVGQGDFCRDGDAFAEDLPIHGLA